MREKLRANIFPHAWPAVEPWKKFPWDRGDRGIRTWARNSSQALAIDVFGSIKVSPDRDAILGALARHIGLPSSGPWSVHFEWTDPYNSGTLNEKRLTQVDVVLKNRASLIFCECKFTEKQGGSCSRPVPRKEFPQTAQCNGNYEVQSDPVRYALFDFYGIAPPDAKCALTREGIRYWSYIPSVLKYDAESIYRPCPFAGSDYQLMRNLVLCSRVARRNHLLPAVLLVYARGEGLSISSYVDSPEWSAFKSKVLPQSITIGATAFQEIVSIAATVSSRPSWHQLARWIESKVAYARSRMRQT